MSKPPDSSLNPHPSQTPALSSFALDQHTRQFFDPAEWVAPAEARFYLDMPGVRGREFLGRIVLFCDDSPLIAMREIGGDGQTLLKRPPYPLDADEVEPQMRPHHWAQWLALARFPTASGCPLPLLPNIAANAGLIRLHYDAATGFGAQVWSEGRRARIFEVDPDGKNDRVYASGIRNPVGLAVHPTTGELWTSVNERDGLGDHLVPDYVTRVKDGGFYGWPWYYIGDHQEPRHPGEHPELKDKVVVPDVLLQSHSASLAMTFYTGTQFPADYHLQAFAAEHGSWNRSRRTGYKVVRIPINGGKATGEYEDFLTGFLTPQGEVWGRPVGVTVAKDGSLLVSDDGSNTIWRVTYTGA